MTGNAIGIPDGSATPQSADFTLFGSTLVSGGTIARTFTIQNSGTGNLTIPAGGITFTGTNAAEFAAWGISLPATILPAGSANFTVTFDPTAAGVRNATVNISNNDSNENPYDFAIQANGFVSVAPTGTAPPLRWSPTVQNASVGSTRTVGSTTSGDVIAATRITSSTSASDLRVTRHVGSTGAVAWTRDISNGTSDDINDMIVDPANGDTYVCARATAGANGLDWFVVKVNGADGTVAWTYTHNGTLGTGADECFDIGRTSDGNIVAVGMTTSTGSNIFARVAKINTTTGAQIWAYVNGTVNSQFNGVATDTLGNTYATGLINAANIDGLTVKLSSAGAQTWAVAFNGTAGLSDSFSNVVVDPNGDCVVGGTTRISATDSDVIVLKYGAAAGNEVWWRTIAGGGAGLDALHNLAVDGSGNFYASGALRSFTTTDRDAFVSKITAAGASAWITTKFGSTPDSNDRYQNVRVFGGDVYAVGDIENANRDILVSRFNGTTGAEVWSATFNGTGNGADDVVSNKHVMAVLGADSIAIGGETLDVSENTFGVVLKYEALLPPVITNGPPPAPGVANTAYNFAYTFTGLPAPSFTNSGTLPNGLSLSGAGVISGTPTLAGVFSGIQVSGTPTVGGTFAGTVTLSNGIAPVATQNFSITVSAPPVITSGPPTATGVRGTAYNFTCTATGFPVPTFAVTAGALPGGLSLSAAGVISGTPGTTGVFTGTITATNGIAPDATQNFSITINQAPAFTNGPPPSPVIVNAPYNFTFAATGSPAPTFSVPASGSPGGFPTGITMNAAGVVSGTPTGTGTTSNITVTATNTAGSVQQVFSITVNPFTTPPSAPVITSANTVTFTVGVAGSTFQMTATGSPAPTFSKTGALPSGVTLSAAGLLSGTPGAGTQGNYPITVTATNANAPDSVQAFTLVVVAPSSITATKDDGTPAATLKNPGDTINYTMAITNTGGAPATNVVLTDPTPANTTLVPGSVHASPIAANDSFTAVGNTKLYVGTTPPGGEPAVSVAGNVLTNDTISTAPDTIVLTTGTFAATQGGSVTINADGTLTYTPLVGFTGTDTFTYAVRNSTDATLADTGTVTITVSNRVWYVDNTGANGNGTSASPFNTVGGAQTASAINDFIYVKKGTATYTGGITLKNGQTFTSESVALVVNSFTLRAAVPANVPTLSHNAASTVALASGNTINSFIITNSAGNGISGAAIGTTAIANIAVTVTGGTALNATTSGTLTVTGTANTLSSTTGAALNVANVTIGAGGLTFLSISAGNNTAAADPVSGIVLNNTGAGGFTVTGDGGGSNNGSGGTIQNTTGAGISLTTVGPISLGYMNVANSGTDGIKGTGITGGFTLNRSNVTDTPTGGATDDGVDLANVSGAVVFTNDLVDKPPHNAVVVDNNNTNMASFTMTGTTLSNDATSNPPQNDGLLLTMRGNSVQTGGNIQGNTFSGHRAVGVQIQTNDSGRIGVNSGTVGTTVLTTRTASPCRTTPSRATARASTSAPRRFRT